MDYIEATLRIFVSFFVLLILTRLIGRKEISQLTFFNFASAIAIGTLAASITVNQSISITYGVYALVIWALLTIVMGLVDIKSKTLRTMIEGQPVIVIKQGQVMEKELKKMRLDIDALKGLLRKKNIFSIQDVDYAILETDGKLSAIKKDGKQTVTKQDMNIPLKTATIATPTQVISDGEIDHLNLEKLQLREEWIIQQLQQAGVQSVSDVFYAEINKDGALYIDKRNDSVR
ncbi:DUF421 domain-containing protein [Bacillaceae bacterium SIJ1]|uniref:YetF domain-containing protein n=1 Tax=Litoribacterium kuwaitense TaxID=1398745 RepID=UPI0013EB2D09|nr:DUF421 domain-containing protein [Litoribacterium kuwaitense]NGP45530.1 DUF421 domain-containing protein [Litoribacterium kuwaitense]